jgi:hypothetical protein
MSGSIGATAGEIVETLRFTASDPPVVATSFRGSTVVRDELGQFTVHLNPLNQIDVLQRTVHVDPASGGTPGRAWERGGTDSTVVIGVSDAAGEPADTGDGVTVTVVRSNND